MAAVNSLGLSPSPANQKLREYDVPKYSWRAFATVTQGHPPNQGKQKNATVGEARINEGCYRITDESPTRKSPCPDSPVDDQTSRNGG